ncbi:MAG: hypothetical protein U9Q18_01505 [Caldisericota bacterium]|nr:hypothetical protein [Caldisericota bacterium]
MPNEDGNYTPEEWKGLLGDKQNEVRTRQQKEADLAASNRTITEQRLRIKELESSTAKVKAGNPEDIMTRADFEKEMNARDKKLEDKYTANETKKSQESLNKRLLASEEKARSVHTEEKEGKGLDFESVMAGTNRQIQENPGYKKVIQEAKNPGEKAYSIGLQDSVIAKRLETYKKTLPPSGVTPKEGMKGKKVPGSYYTPQMVQKMSDAEIDLHYDDIKESQKQWGGKK